jgi:hypothetical protein
MNEMMTLAEIEERLASEWVLIEDPEVDGQFQVIRGKVVWHSKDRDEVDRKMLELRPKSPIILYTGQFPEDTAIVL